MRSRDDDVNADMGTEKSRKWGSFFRGGIFVTMAFTLLGVELFSLLDIEITLWNVKDDKEF